MNNLFSMPLGLNIRKDGDWHPGANPAYDRLDIVRHNGALWAAAQKPLTDEEPGTGVAWEEWVPDIRTPLLSSLTIQVRSDGNDANDGVTSPLATLAEAKERLARIDPRNQKMIVDIGSGTFEMPTMLMPMYNADNLYIQGTGTTETRIANTIPGIDASVSGINFLGIVNVNANNTVRFRSPTGAGTVRFSGYPLTVFGHVYCHNARVEFAPRPSSPETAFTGLFANHSGHISCNENTVFAAIDSPVFNYFALVPRGGHIAFYTATFEGAATGHKYNMYQAGAISGQGDNSDLTTLLGSLPGLVGTLGGAVVSANGVAKASALVGGNGTLSSPFNISSCTLSPAGTYTLTLTNPAPSANYSVHATPGSSSLTGNTLSAQSAARSADSFVVVVKNNGVAGNIGFSVEVNW